MRPPRAPCWTPRRTSMRPCRNPGRRHSSLPAPSAIPRWHRCCSTAVPLAAEVNNLEAGKVLVDAGADPRIATDGGTTPLMLAAGAGTDVQRARSLEERATAVQTVKYLVDHGSDVNAAGQFGWTP